MMNYYRDPDGNVYGYDPADQTDLIALAQEKGWEDVSDSWPPPPTDPGTDPPGPEEPGGIDPMKILNIMLGVGE